MSQCSPILTLIQRIHPWYTVTLIIIGLAAFEDGFLKTLFWILLPITIALAFMVEFVYKRNIIRACCNETDEADQPEPTNDNT